MITESHIHPRGANNSRGFSTRQKTFATTRDIAFPVTWQMRNVIHLSTHAIQHQRVQTLADTLSLPQRTVIPAISAISCSSIVRFMRSTVNAIDSGLQSILRWNATVLVDTTYPDIATTSVQPTNS